MCQVVISKFAEKRLKRIPSHIKDSLYGWIDLVEAIGLIEARKIKGLHDEPLYGDRDGQRSIRLNLSYRAFYILNENSEIIIVTIIEVNHHEY